MLNKIRPALRASRALAVNFKNNSNQPLWANQLNTSNALVYQSMRYHGIFDRFFNRLKGKLEEKPPQAEKEAAAAEKEPEVEIVVEEKAEPETAAAAQEEPLEIETETFEDIQK